MQIVDLSALPASVSLVNTITGPLGSGGTAHNLYIDSHYAYVSGSRTAAGVHIFDLSDPVAPVEVASWSHNYWHDVVVKNDTIYGSAIYGPYIEIIDGTDKSNLRLISRTSYPAGFTHNIWMTADNKYITQTDEIHDLPVNFWDVTDHESPERLARYTAGPGSIAHNTHVIGNFAFISYYYDGLKVIDISDRGAPVEIANYDSYPDDNYQRGPDYEGAWGAYPVLPSGNILISDRKYGLNVVQADTVHAGYVEGYIRLATTNVPVTDAVIEILGRNEDEGYTLTNIGPDGYFRIGIKPGTRSVRIRRALLHDYLLSNISIVPGETHFININMLPATVNDIDEAVSTPDDFQLFSNYPNPFNPETTLRWYQPLGGPVKISLYSREGELLFSEQMERSSGANRFQLDMKAYPSGTYFYQLTVPGFAGKPEKIILIK